MWAITMRVYRDNRLFGQPDRKVPSSIKFEWMSSILKHGLRLSPSFSNWFENLLIVLEIWTIKEFKFSSRLFILSFKPLAEKLHVSFKFLLISPRLLKLIAKVHLSASVDLLQQLNELIGLSGRATSLLWHLSQFCLNDIHFIFKLFVDYHCFIIVTMAAALILLSLFCFCGHRLALLLAMGFRGLELRIMDSVLCAWQKSLLKFIRFINANTFNVPTRVRLVVTSHIIGQRHFPRKLNRSLLLGLELELSVSALVRVSWRKLILVPLYLMNIE